MAQDLARRVWPERPVLASSGLAAAAAYLILAWTRDFPLPVLALAVVCASLAAGFALRRGEEAPPGWFLQRAALLVLLLALAAGAVTSNRFGRINDRWPEVGEARREQLRAELGRRMADVVERGQRAARLAADAVSADEASIFGRLESIRQSTGVDAVMVMGGSANLLGWAGDHRGSLPDEIWDWQPGAFFAERPLFSYLYFTVRAEPPAVAAVAAVLIDAQVADAPGGVSSSRAGELADAGVGFRSGGAAEDDWHLIEDGDTVLHARLQPITQASLRQDVEKAARGLCVVFGLGVLILLGAAWLRWTGPSHTRGRTTVPLIALALGMAVAPLGTALGLDALFEPSLFVLATPGDVSLGGFLAPVLALAALVATLRPPALDARSYRIALATGSVAIALAYPATLRVLMDASSPTLLEGGGTLWFGLQLAAVLVLAGVTALALPRVSSRPATRQEAALRARRLLFVGAGAVALGIVLAMVVLWKVDPRNARMPWTMVLWVLPFLLLATAYARYGGRAGALTRWLVAGALATTATLPHLWVAQTRARLDAASREVMSIGADLPPIVEFLLVGFGSEVQEQYAQGERGLQLLYRSWVASGLAGEPYGARITLWSPSGFVESEVALGGAEGSDAQSDVVRRLADQGRTADGYRVSGVTGAPGISKVMTVPLGDGRVVSISVPPRRSLERASVLAPFLGAARDPEVQLNLVEAHGGEIPRDEDEIVWERAPGGFSSDVIVRLPDGLYHAHTRVGVTPLGILFARGVLIAAFDLLLLMALWSGGSVARGMSPVPPGAPAALSGSFRARVTLALFGFFLMPTVLFGWAAYRTFANEVERTARVISARAVRQAVQAFPEADLRQLAQLVNSEILYYYNSGELAQASSPDAIGLGVYSAWLTPTTFRLLQSGEELEAQEVRRLGDEQYLFAYHKGRPAGILAVPTSLSSGETAIRQGELAHLILFAALIGALLSFALSVAVGRSLAGPIGRLRRAAALVGAGRLRVRLPEPGGDEFGELYASFNRMVRRLRRARVRERETARVLAWGEMARQVAHEIKNPLTPIKLSVQHLRRANRDRRPDFDKVLEENVDQILIEIDRLTEIARAFSRYGAPERQAPLEAVTVTDVVREALTLYRASDDPIRYHDEVALDLPPIIARRGEMKEVLLNLVENARQALDGRGTITVRAAAADGHVHVSVEDDGPGIPPDLLARVFDPHFSTRSAGTGLGLAIVRRLVESWGGTVNALSEPGRGTTVRLRLEPATDGQRAL